MPTKNITSVIATVQKLLSLSRSANANEAATAAAIANKLIDTYRLSQADLEDNTDPLEEDGNYLYETGRVIPWKARLADTLIDHYGCSAWLDNTYVNGRKYTRYRLVGKRSDIYIVRYMFAWLMAECARLSDIEAKGKGHVFVFSWCEGFVAGVHAQLAASRREAKAQATTSAIVKIDARADQAKEELYRLHPDLISVKSKSSRKIDGSAFASGIQRGKSINLGSKLGAGSSTKMLGN